MNKHDFINEAESLGYTLEADMDGTFKLSRRRSDGVRFIEVTVQGNTVQLEIKTDKENRYSRYVIGGLWNGFKKLRDLDQEIFAEDNHVMRDPENVKAARLIHEIRTIRLAPDEKLLVRITEDVGDLELMTHNLANMVGRWLGDKGLHRVLVVKGAEFIKVQDAKSTEDKIS